MDNAHPPWGHTDFPGYITGEINELVLSHYTCLGLNVTVIVYHTWCKLGKSKFQECTVLPLWIAFACISNSSLDRYGVHLFRLTRSRNTLFRAGATAQGARIFSFLSLLSLNVSFVSKVTSTVSILLAGQRVKIKGGIQHHLFSSWSFPRNATSVIWDMYHGQPRSWTGPCAHLYMQRCQGSVSKDERVKDRMPR